MEPPIQIGLFFLALLAALSVSVIVLAWIVEQYRQGRDVLPYQPRRPVPWQGIHVVLVGVFFIMAPTLVYGFLKITGAASVLGGNQKDSSALREEAVSHQIEQLLRQKQDAWVWGLVVVMAVGAAPLVEEWMFRVVLQGWLEKLERNLRRRIRWLYRMRATGAEGPAEGPTSRAARGATPPWPGKLLGVGPVVISSLLFAGVHYRRLGPTPTPDELLQMLLCQGLGNLLSFLVGIGLLKVTCGATAADFGWSWPHVPRDILKGLGAYLLVLGPVYLVMILTKIFLIVFAWEEIAPDPIPLFFLSLVLGLLYFRTHRLVPCLVLHGVFNATGLVVFWVFS